MTIFALHFSRELFWRKLVPKAFSCFILRFPFYFHASPTHKNEGLFHLHQHKTHKNTLEKMLRITKNFFSFFLFSHRKKAIFLIAKLLVAADAADIRAACNFKLKRLKRSSKCKCACLQVIACL
jgi:hypothetical protein